MKKYRKMVNLTFNGKVVDWRIIVAVIISITILETIALMKGINGMLFSGVLIILAGLAGLVIPTPFKIRS